MTFLPTLRTFSAVLGLGLLPALLPAAAPADEPVVYTPPPPEGYPWLMGQASVTLDGATRSYATYDFSIGAFDASVQFREHSDCSGSSGGCKATGRALLSLVAYPDGDPDAEADLVLVRAVFDKLPKGAKKTRNVTVEIRNPGGEAGGLLQEKPGSATLKLTSVKRGLDGSDSYGMLQARVTATVCEATKEGLIPGGACYPFEATYDTQVQYDSI